MIESLRREKKKERCETMVYLHESDNEEANHRDHEANNERSALAGLGHHDKGKDANNKEDNG